MLYRMCRAKIHRATVTESCVDYEGSIQVDEALLEAAGIHQHEMVLVANINNGHRFETYVIKGPRYSGVIGLNGAAARLGDVGDKIIILAIASVDEKEAKNFIPTFVLVDGKNQVNSIRNGVVHGRH